MRMFQSVSGHSNEQSIADYCSRPTVLQLKCVCETCIKLICESPTTEDKNFKNFNFKPLSFNSIQKASKVDRNRKFSEGIFFNSSQYSKQRPNFSTHRAALIAKTDLIFPAFSLRFADFAVEFCFRCKFSFHDEWPFLPIAINGITSFCKDYRLRQVDLFRVRQSGHRPAQALCWRILK